MKNSEQPAFAVSKEMCEASKITEYPFDLTKREYFAAMAMQGLCANPAENMRHDKKSIAMNAIEIADEILKQLETQIP